jgi:hypothetical protein
MWLPGFDPRAGHVGLMVDKVALGQVFSENFFSPANSHSTKCSILMYDMELVQYAN